MGYQKSLNIKSTVDSPEIVLVPETGVVSIIGNSYMNNPIATYEPVFDWVREYVKSPAEKTGLILDIEYANSATKKIIYDLICLLLTVKDNSEVEISWNYYEDDEDMIDTGKQFEKSSKKTFNFIKK